MIDLPTEYTKNPKLKKKSCYDTWSNMENHAKDASFWVCLGRPKNPTKLNFGAIF